MAAGNVGSPTQLLILLAIVLLVFGGKRLRNLGGDLGGAIKGFKNSMANGEAEANKSNDAKPLHISSEHSSLVSSTEAEKNPLNRAS